VIDHLIKIKEIDLYYYIMNEISIISFNKDMLEISTQGSNKLYNERLQNIISTLIGNKICISTTKTKEQNLKTKMIESIKKSTSWTKLYDKFPGADIIDVIHKDSLV
jgi:DNA polymerase-3 subunit gamma/tau